MPGRERVFLAQVDMRLEKIDEKVHEDAQEAARLLRDTDDKTYLIAEKTGFVDANYFSYVFKKAYGMSPSKYRTEHTAQ